MNKYKGEEAENLAEYADIFKAVNPLSLISDLVISDEECAQSCLQNDNGKQDSAACVEPTWREVALRSTRVNDVLSVPRSTNEAEALCDQTSESARVEWREVVLRSTNEDYMPSAP